MGIGEIVLKYICCVILVLINYFAYLAMVTVESPTVSNNVVTSEYMPDVVIFAVTFLNPLE